jgi:hypothetical protein
MWYCLTASSVLTIIGFIPLRMQRASLDVVRNAFAVSIFIRCCTVIYFCLLCSYEGKSLNNRNFIITFLQEYLYKFFVSYFLT